MKVGLLARGEDRGLGIQTWEFHRAIRPERTMLIDMGELARGFPMHPDRYPDAMQVNFGDTQALPEKATREWLDGLDVVFTAETFYDWRIIGWANDQGVATVCQLNPEFYKHPHEPHTPHPTMWWAPSPWRLKHLHEDTRLVGVPVAADRFPMVAPEPADRLRVLHVAGHRAVADRNGTLQLLQAARLVRSPMVIRILTQDGRLPRIKPHRHPRVEVIGEPGGRPNYWDLYDDADLLMLPRRYGGLCLPTQEAMACGLAVAMTDCPPNEYWPNLPLHARKRQNLNTATGLVPMWAADPRGISDKLDRMAKNPEALAGQQAASLEWARAHSWDAMLPFYMDELALAADRV